MEHQEYSDTKMVLVDNLQIHEAASLFPEMGEEEIEKLAADIAGNGIQVPIGLNDGCSKLRAGDPF